MKRRRLFRKLATLFCAGILGLGIFAGLGNVGYAAQSGSIDWPAESGIGLSYYNGDKEVSWSSDTAAKSVTGLGKSSKTLWWQNNYKSTLGIKSLYAGTLSFDYKLTLSSGSITIDGESKTENGSFSKKVTKEQNVEVILNTGSTSTNTQIVITNLSLFIPVAKVTAHFVSNPNLTYVATADGKEIPLDEDFEATTETLFSVKKTAISSDYSFIGWVKNGEFVSGETLEFKIRNENEKVTVSPYLVNDESATFSVDGSEYPDLQLAINAAKKSSSSTKLITLKKTGSVFPKDDGSAYDLNGINLFIPGNANDTFGDFTDDNPPTNKTESNLSINYCLTIKTGAILNFSNKASLVVASTSLIAGGGKMTSCPMGGTGEIDMETGSNINFATGTSLYCWGFIAGEGTVLMKSGSSLREMFQFYWRGGTASSNLDSDKKSFLFNQYYVQNIEATLKMEYGSSEVCFAAFEASKIAWKTTLNYVGNNGMFVLKEGATLKRKYDAKTDRVKYSVDGDGSISHINLKVAFKNFDSADYALPIASNMDLEMESGTVQILQKLDFIPGVTLTIDDGAVVEVASNYSICLYDYSNWNGKKYATIYGDIERVNHVSKLASEDFKTSGTSRTNNTNGATITVGGSLQVNGDLISTKPTEDNLDVTKTGRILGTEGGKVAFKAGYTGNGQSVSHVSYQYATNSTQTEIKCTTVNLVNGDGTFFESSATSTQLIYYQNARWSVKNQGSTEITITYLNADGSTELLQKTYTIPDTEEALPTEKAFTNFQGKIFLWLEKDNETTSYAPGYKINQFKSNITLAAFTGGWYTDLKRDTYYYDSAEGKVTGLYHVAKDQKDQTLYFDEEGILQSNWSGFFQFTSGKTYSYHGDDGIYYLENGVVSYQEGLRVEDVPVSSTETKRNYYYFGKTGRAVQNKTLYLAASKLNGLLAEGTYTFGSDSKLTTLECSNFNHVIEVTLQDGVCYYGDIKAGIGLFESDGHIYYAKDDGSILKDATYYVVDGKLNGQTDAKGSALKEGLYYFDSNGILCDSSLNPISKEAQA